MKKKEDNTNNKVWGGRFQEKTDKIISQRKKNYSYSRPIIHNKRDHYAPVISIIGIQSGSINRINCEERIKGYLRIFLFFRNNRKIRLLVL